MTLTEAKFSPIARHPRKQTYRSRWDCSKLRIQRQLHRFANVVGIDDRIKWWANGCDGWYRQRKQRSNDAGGVRSQLILYASDIAKLSPGPHTLKCDYLGDRKYAPSAWEEKSTLLNKSGVTGLLGCHVEEGDLYRERSWQSSSYLF